MSSELEFEVPSWEQIYNMLLSLASKIRKAKFQPDIIVGVSRGGWPPARIMSDLLEKSEIANVKAEFYLDVAKTKGEPVITQPVSMSVKDKRVLVVDDVADSGKSLRLVRLHLKEQGASAVKIVTIYYKPWSVVIPDWYEKKTSRWIIFPWERVETVRSLLKKYGDEVKVRRMLVGCGMEERLVDRLIRWVSSRT